MTVLTIPRIQDTHEYTVEEILDSFTADYNQEIINAAERGEKKYKHPFYVQVIAQKDHMDVQIMKNFFIPRQTLPHALDYIVDYPYAMHVLYRVDAHGSITLIWSLPGYYECFSIAKNPDLYDPQVLKWIYDCFGGKMIDGYDT